MAHQHAYDTSDPREYSKKLRQVQMVLLCIAWAKSRIAHHQIWSLHRGVTRMGRRWDYVHGPRLPIILTSRSTESLLHSKKSILKDNRFTVTMARFIWKFLYIIGTIPHLLIPVIASPQFDKDFTLPALGDSPTPQVATPPNPAPDALPDDFQWTTSQAQNPNLLAQPQSLDDLNDGTFDPSLIALSPADTQTADPKSSPVSGSCAAKANLKPGASRLLRRAYGERQPCCDPVNLGLDNPMNWLFGQDHIETRSPYCCEGGAIEYARRRLCVPCMYMYIYNPSSFPLPQFAHQLMLCGFFLFVQQGNKATHGVKIQIIGRVVSTAVL